jgi:hypothetical protein
MFWALGSIPSTRKQNNTVQTIHKTQNNNHDSKGIILFIRRLMQNSIGYIQSDTAKVIR